MRGTLRTARCRIALLGFGTVGSAVARRLTGPGINGIHDPPEHLELTHIFDRRAAHKREIFAASGADAHRLIWTTAIDEIFTSDVDVVVEAVGGVEPAADWIRAALLAGKSVVTANKQAVARHGAALLALAERQGRQLRFEAAVGGAMPIVRALGGGLAGDRVTRIVAILNGTTNAVLSRMEAAGCSLDEAIDDARERGYAEADPSVDLDGGDASAKLSILCALAFGLRVEPDAIPTRSAASISQEDFDRARRNGGTVRQLAHAEYDRASATLTAWVAPTVVPHGSIFARTTGPQNAAVITGAYSGDITIAGAGAGGDATAVAILSDLVAIARDRAAIVPAPVLSTPRTIVGLPTTLNAEHAEHAENVVLGGFSGFCVDRDSLVEAV
jgi:homoserine dehydrogenase